MEDHLVDNYLKANVTYFKKGETTKVRVTTTPLYFTLLWCLYSYFSFYASFLELKHRLLNMVWKLASYPVKIWSQVQHMWSVWEATASWVGVTVTAVLRRISQPVSLGFLKKRFVVKTLEFLHVVTGSSAFIITPSHITSWLPAAICT